MSSRRLSVLLLGIWLGCGFFMGWVATHNLDSADEVLRYSSDRVQREIQDIGADRAKTLLRFQAAEMNRHYFYNWELVQLGLGLLAVISLLFATNGSKFVLMTSSMMLLLTVVQHFIFTPQLMELGRGLDFAGAEEMLDERKAFAGAHGYYMGSEAVKLLLGIILTLRLLLAHRSGPRRKRRKSGDPIDMIDDSNHGHVDG